MVRLIDRRFVPLYFDLSPAGAAADRAARIFVARIKPELAELSVDTPPVLVCTPAGELLAEIDNYATEEQLLAALRDALAKHPEWNAPSAEETRLASAGSPIERANFLFDLGHDEAACRLLAKQGGEEAALLLAHFCRITKQWDAMEAALARVASAPRQDAVHVEQAWHRFAAGEFAAIGPLVEGVPAADDRYTEARYLVGLAQWHQGRKDDALESWKTTIEQCAQDPWIYRADWAYTFAKQGSEHGEFSSVGPRFSPLGRIGYGGRRPPDLEPR